LRGRCSIEQDPIRCGEIKGKHKLSHLEGCCVQAEAVQASNNVTTNRDKRIGW
jgi:hypothetical protein